MLEFSATRHREVVVHGYFHDMPLLGAETSAKVADAGSNQRQLEDIEKNIAKLAEGVKNAGQSVDGIHEKGMLTVWERMEKLADPGTLLPLHTLFNPEDNAEGSTGVIDGLAKVAGKWCAVAGFDNKILSGAWLPGQSEHQLRIGELAKRLNIPLVWLNNCSGVKLSEQHKVYGGKRGTGAAFYRHANLALSGVPVIAGVWGVNPAGGGYQTMSTSWIAAHKDAVVAAGGALAGQSIQGPFTREAGENLISLLGALAGKIPGTADVHGNITGFFSKVCETEDAVIEAVRERVSQMPSFAPEYFRVDEPLPPKDDAKELYARLPFDQNSAYSLEACLACLVDGGQNMEFKPLYGPEVYCGLVKVRGLPVAVIGNRQGALPEGYPAYARGGYQGVGGKLYREGVIKMAEFVALCNRDRLPVIWLQDTEGLDVGVEAEKAEILALGMTLMYSIEQSDLPMALIVLRKGLVAGHYVRAGPIANSATRSLWAPPPRRSRSCPAIWPRP
jgi:glutaconyl-CoA decarboxylase